jgi:hypothetical protein
MFKRGGRYYLMWSEGGWTGPDYSVSYAIANSPTGPFTKLDKVLAQDPAVAKGSGHNSVLNVPGTDIWYIVYHRRPLSETDGNHRQLAYDRMTFNPDGTIQRITMRVRDNFGDGNAYGWQTYGGSWASNNGRYTVNQSLGSKALLDTNFGNLTYDADVTVTAGGGGAGGDAGLLFRTSAAAVGIDAYNGYYAGINAAGRVVLGRAANSWTQLGSAAITPGASHHVRVTAVGPQIAVYVDDLATPKISVTDATYASGATGVRVFDAAAAFDNIAVGAPAGTNFAVGRPATGSAPCVASEGPEKAVNGSVIGGNADKFCSVAAGAWLQVDLGASRAINRFEVAHAAAGGESRCTATGCWPSTGRAAPACGPVGRI